VIVIAEMNGSKAFSISLTLVAACVVAAIAPFLVDGGVQGVIDGSARGSTPLLVGLIVSPFATAIALHRTVMLLRWRGPSVYIDDDTLFVFGWKRPVPLREISHLTLLPPPRHFAQPLPYVTLKSGEHLLLPNLQRGHPRDMLDRLAVALDQVREDAYPR